MGERVKVNLSNARVWGGTAYGPGQGIGVPPAAAKAWGLSESLADRMFGLSNVPIGVTGPPFTGTPAAVVDEHYETMTMAELKDAADKRGLSVKGRTKADYVAALRGG